MTAPQAERCAGTTTPTTTWRPASKVRPKPCVRPVTYVVDDGSRSLNACTAHLGGITGAAASRVRGGSVSVWRIAAWRAEIET